MTGAIITDIALTIGQVLRGNDKILPKALVVLSLLVFFPFWIGRVMSFYTHDTQIPPSDKFFSMPQLFWARRICPSCRILLGQEEYFHIPARECHSRNVAMKENIATKGRWTRSAGEYQ